MLGALGRAAREGVASLRESPRSLLVVFALKVLESYNYFSLSRILTLYLSEDFGVSDLDAGSAYGAWGTLLTLYGLVLGGAIDWLGVRTSLVVCFALGAASRAAMAWASRPWVVLAALLGPNAAAGALGVPVMTIAVKRFTTERNRGFAFSLFYALMNVAALGQGLLLDVFRAGLDQGNRWFVASGVATSLAGLALTLVCLGEPEGEGEAGLKARGGGGGPAFSLAAARRLFASRGFIKYLGMCLATVNLKALFRHLDATLPKYQLRAFGAGAPIGAVYAINPAMIVALVPAVGALTTAVPHFDMILAGAWASAVSPLAIVAAPALWGTALFVALLSLGEAAWSPRWYDYSMSVAPEGREGLFTALTSAPLFLAQLPTGVLSGALLQRFCPSAESCDGRALWGVVAALALASPLAICAGQRWLRPRADDFVFGNLVPMEDAENGEGGAGVEELEGGGEEEGLLGSRCDPLPMGGGSHRRRETSDGVDEGEGSGS